MPAQRREVRSLLIAMEGELKALDLWAASAPSPEALASSEPFCVDTLSLSQWLQWILVPRMHALLEGGHPLPGNCNIEAIATESFKEMEQDCSELLRLIGAFDRALAPPR